MSIKGNTWAVPDRKPLKPGHQQTDLRPPRISTLATLRNQSLSILVLAIPENNYKEVLRHCDFQTAFTQNAH